MTKQNAGSGPGSSEHVIGAIMSVEIVLIFNRMFTEFFVLLG